MPSEISFKRVKCKPIKNPFKKPEWDKRVLFALLGIFFFLLLIFFLSKIDIGNVGQTISEEQEEGRTAIIRDVIEVEDAEHLNSDRKFIRDITDEVKKFDDIWSEEISDGEYVRVEFEQLLNSESDIKIYPRIVSGNPKIKVHEIDEIEIIAEFTSINSNEYNKVLLTNLVGEQDSFDLKVLDGSIEIEHIVDPFKLNMKKEAKK